MNIVSHEIQPPKYSHTLTTATAVLSILRFMMTPTILDRSPQWPHWLLCMCMLPNYTLLEITNIQATEVKHWDDLTLLSNISNISTIYWPGPGVWLILPPVHKHALLQVRPSTAAACQSPLWPPGRAELSNMKPKLQFAPRSGHKNRNFPRRHNEEMRIGNKPHSGSRSSAGHHFIQLAGWVMKCILNISYSSYINWQYKPDTYIWI